MAFFRMCIALTFPLFLVVGVVSQSMAQDGPTDSYGKLIFDMFQGNQGKTLCPSDSTTINSARGEIADYLKAATPSPVTGKAVAEAMWFLYPCPFSPTRTELRLATKEDLEGVWVFPENSQKLRYGPRSSRQPLTGSFTLKCEVMAYYRRWRTTQHTHGERSRVSL